MREGSKLVGSDGPHWSDGHDEAPTFRPGRGSMEHKRPVSTRPHDDWSSQVGYSAPGQPCSWYLRSLVRLKVQLPPAGRRPAYAGATRCLP